MKKVLLTMLMLLTMCTVSCGATDEDKELTQRVASLESKIEYLTLVHEMDAIGTYCNTYYVWAVYWMMEIASDMDNHYYRYSTFETYKSFYTTTQEYFESAKVTMASIQHMYELLSSTNSIQSLRLVEKLKWAQLHYNLLEGALQQWKDSLDKYEKGLK